jgi:hypothetical protein
LSPKPSVARVSRALRDDERVERSVQVWAVDLVEGTPAKERAGTLSLDDEDLRFQPSNEGEPGLSIPLRGIDGVKRLRGSPVLVVRFRREAEPWRTAFYFVQPPPLATFIGHREDANVLATLRNPKRKARRENVGYLGLSNRVKKQEVIAWERAVRMAIAAARGR